jgi:hypothetical protein
MVYGFSQLSHSIHMSKPCPTDVLTDKHRVSQRDGFEKDKLPLNIINANKLGQHGQNS